MQNMKIGMPFWKRTLYWFLLLVFLAIGANIWDWIDSIFLSFIIMAISIAMITFFWNALQGKKENADGEQSKDIKS